MTGDFPKLRVTVSEGRRVFTNVELDGRQIPALRVAFDTGDVRDKAAGLVTVHMEFYADIELIAEGGLPLITAAERKL